MPKIFDYQNFEGFEFLKDNNRYCFLRAMMQACVEHGHKLSNEQLKDLFIMSGVSFLDYMREGLITGVNGRSVLRELRDKTNFTLLSLFEKKSQLSCPDVVSLSKLEVYPALLFRKNGSVCSMRVKGDLVTVGSISKGFLYMVFH